MPTPFSFLVADFWLSVVYVFAQWPGQLFGSSRPQNPFCQDMKRRHMPHIKSLHCLDCQDNDTHQSYFEDDWKGTKLIGHLRNPTPGMRLCHSPFCRKLFEVFPALSLGHERPSTLRGANLSFSRHDNWEHLGALGAEHQQAAKARGRGRNLGAGEAKPECPVSCPRNNCSRPSEQHLEPALPSFLLRYQRVSSRLPLGVQKWESRVSAVYRVQGGNWQILSTHKE